MRYCKAGLCPRRNMNDIKKRLSRTLSGPRRCNKCQKMVYFPVYRCKLCQELTHKHCLYHTNHSCNPKSSEHLDTNGFPNLNSVDYEVWRSPTSPRDLWAGRRRPESPGSANVEDIYRQHHPGAAMAGLLKIVQWLSHRRRAPQNPATTARGNEKHAKGKFGLRLDVEDKHTKKKLKSLIKNYQRQMQMSGSSDQQQPGGALPRHGGSWSSGRPRMGPHRRPSSGSDVASPRSSVSSHGSSFVSPAGTPDIDAVRMRRDKMVKQASIKWERDVAKSSLIANTSHLPPPRVEAPDLGVATPAKHIPVSPKNSVRINEPAWQPMNKAAIFAKNLLDAKATTMSFARPPCLSKAKTLSVESRTRDNESLCATWPPVGKAGTILEEIVDETEADCIEEADESFTMSDFRSDSQSGEDSLREWHIPFADIDITERIRHGRTGDIFRGRWYGEVLVYTRREADDEAGLKEFMEEVAQMGMIRHENVVLFMGACVEPNRLAVVTSMRKGPTLYEYLHLKRHRLPFHSKHNIARQIAQGIGYLHAKDIVHKKLNSKNVILECRVKVCIMDHGMADQRLDRHDCGCISRGHLGYLSPELMASLQVQPPCVFPAASHTHASDVFAFGSLLYELLCEQFTFHDQPAHALIWQVARGRSPPLHHFRFISGLKILIKRCWSKIPDERPPFSEIVHILQENVSQHRRHSCSEPDLHLAGQGTSSRGMCT